MINIRKIASLLASAAMIGSTAALAAAANYPAPFVDGGNANVAVVYGSGTGAELDLAAVVDITTNLQAKLASQTASGGSGASTSVSGEAYALYTSSSPLLMNQSLNAVRETLTDSNLPTVLADGTFEGSSTVGYKQRITVGSNPKIKYAAQPSDDDDPQFGIGIGTTASTQYVYNASIDFDENVNFTHSDSLGEELTMFGQTYSVGGASTTTKLVLLKSSQTLSLSSDANPSETVNVEGNEYVVELVSASDTAATIKVTDSSGASQTKEVTEDNSKTIQSVEVGVKTADETNIALSSTITVGSNRITLVDGSAIKVGTDEDLIDGTQVEFELANGTQATNPGGLGIGKIIFHAAAATDDLDAIVPGQSFVDPIFGSFKVDFVGLTSQVGDANREIIEIDAAGSGRLGVNFKSHHSGSTADAITWVYNKTDAASDRQDLADGSRNRFVVAEKELINQTGYVVLANDKEGGLYQVTSITNSSDATDASQDEITLKNVHTSESKTFKADTEGAGTISLEGKDYAYTYTFASTTTGKARQVRISMPESTGQDMILFPTIKTSKGAKIAFYEPTNVTLNNWDGAGGNLSNVSNFRFQDGDGYTSVAVSANTIGDNWTVGGTALNLTAGANSGTGEQSVIGAVGKLNYNFTNTGNNVLGAPDVTVYLTSPQGGNIINPALIIFEEKDDANNYEAVIVTTDSGYDGSSNGVGVGDLIRTVEADGDTSGTFGQEIRHEVDEDIYSDTDLWGSVFTLDQSDSNLYTASISYPDDQVEALVYVAENSASISSTVSGGTVSELGNVAVSDGEVGSVAGKSLIVVGGSCVNSVAADLLDSATPLCGADWEAKTSVGSGSFLIETFDRGSGNVATLVAGYNAVDTANAAKALTTQTVDTGVGKKYTGTTSASISLVEA